MMQFTEIPKLPSSINQFSLHQTTTMMNRVRPWPGFSTSKATTSSSLTNNIHSSNVGDANCMEQLLVHCAQAIENNDPTPAQQILWVLNNIAPPDGDTNQRLTCAFLRALILRVARIPACKFMINSSNATNTATATATTVTANTNDSSNISSGWNKMLHKLSLLDLANFVHLTPWHRFGFTAANSVILEAIEGHTAVHIVDFSVSHCMQIPTLIDSIATRYQGRQPPTVRLTVGAFSQQVQVPPMFDSVSYEDLGVKLINFARSKGVVLEFKAVPTTPLDGFASVLNEVRTRQEQLRFMYLNQNNSHYEEEESLVINCQMAAHLLNHEAELEEHPSPVMSLRTMFFKALRTLNPTMVVMVEEDVDFTSRNLVGRLKSAFNYFWIPFDTVDTFLPRGSKQREWYETDICWKIENVISHEGEQRVERQEPRARWAHRIMEAEFQAVGIVGEAVAEVKAMLEEHATGWGSKKEDEDLVLTWKGHNVVFATALIPC